MSEIIRKVVLPVLFAIGLTFGIGMESQVLGDYLLSHNNIDNAIIFYHLSSTLNPLQTRIKDKIAFGQARKNTDTLFTQANTTTKVLGISTKHISTVPILTYHQIQYNDNPTDTLEAKYSVTPYMFEEQMKYIKSHGYNTITFDDLDKNYLHHIPFPVDNPIIITFDDGDITTYTQAYPMLKQYGLRATIFVTTNFVGLPNYLTWDQIEEMADSGVIQFASHTSSQTDLTLDTTSVLEHELIDSRQLIISHTNQSVTWLRYPYGKVNDSLIGAVKQAGYTGAVTSENTSFYSDNDPQDTLPTIDISGSDSIELFGAKLEEK